MRLRKKLILGATAIAIIAIGSSSYYYSFTHWIPAGYVGIIYNAQGGLENHVYKPQAVTLSYFQQLYTYPTKIQNAVYSEDPSMGEVKAADGIAITTSDNANTVFDISVIYHVQPNDVFKVFKAFGPIPIEDIQSQHIRRAVKDGASAVGTQYDLFALMGPKREEASDRLTKELQGRLAEKGITIDRAMILTSYPAQSFSQKISQRVGGIIQLNISDLNSQIAVYSKQTSLVAAEAQQKAQEIAASGVTGKAAIVIDLDNKEAAIDRWSGKLPPYSKDSHVTVLQNGEAAVAATQPSGRTRSQR